MTSMVAFDVCDMVLGSRIVRGGALAGGMPLYKYIANSILMAFESLMLTAEPSEYQFWLPGLQSSGPHNVASAGELRRLRL